jgi:arylsulfatase A-like enzyme
MKNRPNIIYLNSHDTGRCISPYGYKVRTPNLQRFAEEGVVFRQCFTVNPTCSPSRAALLTGEYAHSCGMYGLAHRGFEMPDYSKHLLHTLRGAGYKSYLLGVQHIIDGSRVSEVGFDEVLPNPGKNTDELVPPACNFLREKHAEPFYIEIGMFETHRIFPKHDPEDDPRYTLPPGFLPDTPETREDMADFNTSAYRYDLGVGKILDCLDETGLADNTLVIITTDHGIAFPKAKCNMYDPGIGVLLMMRGPAGFSGGKVIDSLVSHVDVFPTICEILGIEAPARLQGVSFLPMVTGETDSVRDEIFAEVNFHASYEPWRCVRTKRYKYGCRWLKRDHVILTNCDDGLSKTLLVENGWTDRKLVQEELYDLILDPNEMNNLIGQPDMQDIADDLRRRLETWMRKTGDPALNGMPGSHCVPTAIVNDRDEFTPSPRTASRLTPELCRKNEIPGF